MNLAALAPPAQTPEWRRSGHFFVLALFLHALVLFYPLQRAIQRMEAPPLRVQLLEPPQALPMAPSPPTPPAAKESKPPRQEKPPTPRPPQRQLIALAAEQAAPSNFALPQPSQAPAAVASTLAPPAPTSPVAAPQPTLTPARFDAAYLNNPRPAYPPLSRRLGEEGKVMLRVRVASDGQTLTVDIEKSSNFPRLDDAARQAVSRWRFVPARRGDETVEATVIVPLVFHLDD